MMNSNRVLVGIALSGLCLFNCAHVSAMPIEYRLCGYSVVGDNEEKVLKHAAAWPISLSFAKEIRDMTSIDMQRAHYELKVDLSDFRELFKATHALVSDRCPRQQGAIIQHLQQKFILASDLKEQFELFTNILSAEESVKKLEQAFSDYQQATKAAKGG